MIDSYDEYVLACLELLPHEYRYRVTDVAVMSDHEYDLRVKEIKDFEYRLVKDEIVSYSPTQYVAFADANQLVMKEDVIK